MTNTFYLEDINFVPWQQLWYEQGAWIWGLVSIRWSGKSIYSVSHTQIFVTCCQYVRIKKYHINCFPSSKI